GGERRRGKGARRGGGRAYVQRPGAAAVVGGAEIERQPVGDVARAVERDDIGFGRIAVRRIAEAGDRLVDGLAQVLAGQAGRRRGGARRVVRGVHRVGELRHILIELVVDGDRAGVADVDQALDLAG